MNKTICLRDFNRKTKRDRIPSEILSGKDFDSTINWIKQINADRRTRAEKLRRFMAAAVDKDFTNRHLSDTRYISKAAAAYLGLLYGGVYERPSDGVKDGTQRIYPGNGRISGFLRTILGISRLLGKSAEKSREDHRHHAIDAVVIALTDPKWSVDMLQDAARKAEQVAADRHFVPDQDPVQPKTWKGVFRKDVERAIQGMIVSHRESRKVSGEIHKDKIFSRVKGMSGAKEGLFTLRKSIDELTVPEIATPGRIIDVRVYDGIHALLRAHGIDLSKAKAVDAQDDDESSENNDGAEAKPAPGGGGGLAKRIQSLLREHPIELTGHNQRKLRVRHVSVLQKVNPITIGEGKNKRLVRNADNHHTVVYSYKDDKGVERWAHNCVMLKEAYDRLAAQRAAYVANLKAAVSDPKLLRRATHERPLTDQKLHAITVDARRRAVADNPIVDRNLKDGKKFLFSLAKGDHIEIDDPEKIGVRAVYRVLSLSPDEIKIIRTTDNSKEAISGKDRERIRGSGDGLRERNTTKVTLTRLGEVRRAGG